MPTRIKSWGKKKPGNASYAHGIKAKRTYVSADGRTCWLGKEKPPIEDIKSGKWIHFPSKLEAKTFMGLKLRERAGDIGDLILQPKFRFTARIFATNSNGRLDLSNYAEEPITYRSDFAYYEKGKKKRIVHEAKGGETKEWKRKRRLFETLYPEYELRVTTK